MCATVVHFSIKRKRQYIKIGDRRHGIQRFDSTSVCGDDSNVCLLPEPDDLPKACSDTRHLWEERGLITCSPFLYIPFFSSSNSYRSHLLSWSMLLPIPFIQGRFQYGICYFFFKVELFRRIVFLINTSKAQRDRNNALNDEIYGPTLLQRTSCTLKHSLKLAIPSICKV